MKADCSHNADRCEHGAASVRATTRRLAVARRELLEARTARRCYLTKVGSR